MNALDVAADALTVVLGLVLLTGGLRAVNARPAQWDASLVYVALAVLLLRSVPS
jgi:hypothetical protein